MARLTARMDGDGEKVWSRPPVAKRQEFLAQMVDLASRVSTPKPKDRKAVEGATESNVAQEKLQLLLAQGDYSEAFFVARRLVAEGEDWAIEYMDKARIGLD